MSSPILDNNAPRYSLWAFHIMCLMYTVPAWSETGQSSTPATASGKIIELVAGSYTGGNSEGVYRFVYNTQSHSFSQPTLLTPMKNPSFGALSNDKTRLYFVEEGREGRIRSFNHNSDNSSVTDISALSSRGENPCHVSLSPNEQHLAVANYSSGNVAVFKLSDAGALLEGPTVLQHQGRGPNVKRQEGPHAHWAQWDPQARFLYAVNLGTDQVMAYPFEPSNGHIGTGFTALEADPGAGPRHMVFHPIHDWVYLINELSNQIVFAKRESDGRLTTVQRISTLPDDFNGPSQAAHIAVNNAGTRLYSSNRGHDSIAVFEIAGDGKLRILQHIGTQGHWPRFFLLLDNDMLLLVANERTNNVVAFQVDTQGMISPTGESVEIFQPTYLGELTRPP